MRLATTASSAILNMRQSPWGLYHGSGRNSGDPSTRSARKCSMAPSLDIGLAILSEQMRHLQQRPRRGTRSIVGSDLYRRRKPNCLEKNQLFGVGYAIPAADP